MENMVLYEKKLNPERTIMFENMRIPDSRIPKYIVRSVVGISVTKTVNRIIDSIVDYEELDRKDQIVTRIGSFGIGGAASTAAGQYTDGYVDAFYEIFAPESVQETQKEDPIIIEHE